MVSVKSFLTFCTQPDRDFVPFLCITGQGFHIVLSDHVGHIETNVIPFSHRTGTLIFLQMVMGLASSSLIIWLVWMGLGPVKNTAKAAENNFMMNFHLLCIIWWITLTFSYLPLHPVLPLPLTLLARQQFTMILFKTPINILPAFL